MRLRYRGERFSDWPRDVKGNNDLLALTQPERSLRVFTAHTSRRART